MDVINDRNKLKKQLLRQEGLKLTPYRDSEGVLTIGVGRNLEDVGISEHEAWDMLDNDVSVAISECSKHIRGFMELSEARKAVLVNMTFNLGMPRLKTFKRMFKALYVQAFDEVADEMLDSKWAGQVGKRAVELAHMMRNDVWPQ